MHITRIDARLLRVPTGKSIGLPMSGAKSNPASSIVVLLVQIETSGGVSGLGFSCHARGGRSLLATIEDDLAPWLVGENPLHHERLWSKAQSLDLAGVQESYAAIDIALWDLKGKAAGQPLWQLLGGVRDSAKVFTAETASSGLSADDVIALARNALAKGIRGLRMSVRGIDPEADSQKILAVRDAIGEDPWFAVSIENPLDYETALPMARFIEEEIGADWLEDPLADADLSGYSRLSSRLDTPLAAGSRFNSISQFARLIETGAPITLRPDVGRLGGITPWLKVAALGEIHRRPVAPRLGSEIAVHLACGLPGVQAVEFVSWMSPLLVNPLVVANGELTSPMAPGLGLELNFQELDRYQGG